MTGKWSAEQDDVSNIKMKLTQFKGNIAALKEQSPREFLELLSMKLDRIQRKIKGRKNHSFFDSRARS